MSILENRKLLSIKKKMGLISPIEMSPSEFVSRVLYLKGKPFSFDGYQWLPQIYDTNSKNIVLKFGRQSSKSTFQANYLTMMCTTNSNFSALYVAPTQNQTSIWSKQKLQPVLTQSPFIKEFFFSRHKNDQVYYRRFSNDSDITLKSAFLDADSIRGISADLLCIDEIQDIIADCIPVIEETLTRSAYKIKLYTGTPKTNQHAIEHYWDRSSQNEWMIPCKACNYWNRTCEDNIMPEGLSCAKCRKRINTLEGQWVAFGDKYSEFEGYRVPQIIISWIPWSGPEGSIISKYKAYPKEKFYNEVLALPYDNSSCPVTIQDVMEACDPFLDMVYDVKNFPELNTLPLVGGIDYGTSTAGNSFTVLTIGSFLPGGQFVVIYAKKYEGAESDPIYQVNDMAEILQKYNVRAVGCDYGYGASQNRILADLIGDHRVIEFNASGMQKQALHFNKDGGFYTINRTLMMSEVFNGVKQKRIVFPKWEQSKKFLEDLLHVFIDVKENTQTLFYSHAPNKPDDFVHSLMFAYLAGKLNQEL